MNTGEELIQTADTAWPDQPQRQTESKWDALRAWLARSADEYQQGQMMSIAESTHGESVMREVLAVMMKLDTTDGMETLTITKPQLEAALLRWVQDARDGKTLTNEEAANLTVEQNAAMSAEGLWRDLGQQVPNANS